MVNRLALTVGLLFHRWWCTRGRQACSRNRTLDSGERVRRSPTAPWLIVLPRIATISVKYFPRKVVHLLSSLKVATSSSSSWWWCRHPPELSILKSFDSNASTKTGTKVLVEVPRLRRCRFEASYVSDDVVVLQEVTCPHSPEPNPIKILQHKFYDTHIFKHSYCLHNFEPIRLLIKIAQPKIYAKISL